VRTLHLDEPDYPTRLRDLNHPPPAITVSAPLAAAKVIAIVGSRDVTSYGRQRARELAAQVVRAGGIVVSGGALGVDAAAHEGALDAGGRTWAVAPSGSDHVVPVENEKLYARIRESEGSAVIWPFPAHVRGRKAPFLRRNGVLAALSHALVVVQAGFKSGARNAASWARTLGRPVYVVVPDAWHGCAHELKEGARLLTETDGLLASADLPSTISKTPPATPLLTRPLSDTEVLVLKALSASPSHTDEVVLRVGLSAPAVTTALLTLALEDVVVEGPGGFFRRVCGP
jgi:DNA processing protein